MTKTIGYTQSQSLNRASEERKDEAQIKAWIQQDQCRLIPYYKGLPRVIPQQEGGFQIDFISPKEYPQLLKASTIFLGILDSNQPIFAVDIPTEESLDMLTSGGEFKNVRHISGQLTPVEENLLMYGQGLMYWHSKHQYCSNCGTLTNIAEGGHLRVCPQEHCKRLSYPRINPAVIVLIESLNEHGEPICLLARHNRHAPQGMMSTLAGFVEVGETLEETVKREMYEEAGINIESAQYIASQPWPFPSSLMLGFRAQTKETAITLDENELIAAQWFTAEELRKSIETGELIPSRPDSIARYLILDWMEEQLAPSPL